MAPRKKARATKTDQHKQLFGYEITVTGSLKWYYCIVCISTHTAEDLVLPSAEAGSKSCSELSLAFAVLREKVG